MFRRRAAMKKKARFLLVGILLAALTGNTSIYAQEETGTSVVDTQESVQQEDSRSENTRPERPQPEKREIQEGDIVLADNEELLFLIEGEVQNKEKERNRFYPFYLENRGDERLCVFITGLLSQGKERGGIPSPFIIVEPGQRYEDWMIGQVRFTSEGEELGFDLSVACSDEYTSYVERVGRNTWYSLFSDGKMKKGLPFQTIWSGEVILELQDGKLIRKEMTQKQEMLAGTFYGQEWLDHLSSDQMDTAGGVYTDLEDGVRIWIPDNWYLSGEEKEIKNTYSADYSTLESSKETGESNWKLYNSDFTHMLRIRKLDMKTMLGNLAAAAYVVTEDQLYTELEGEADESRRILINGHKALLMTKEGYDDTYDTFIVWMSKNKSVFIFIVNGQEEEWSDDEKILALPREGEDVYMQTLQKVLNSIEISGLFGRKGAGKQETPEAYDTTQEKDPGNDEENVQSAMIVRSSLYSVDSSGTISFYENGLLKEYHLRMLVDRSGNDSLQQYDKNGNMLLQKNISIRDGKEDLMSHVSWDYEYDEEGRILSAVQTDHLDGTEGVITYEYEFDESGNPVCRTAFGKDGKPTITVKMEYDESGRVIRQTSEGPDGTMYSDKEYAYNGQDQLIREINYDPESLKSGERKAWLTTSYDYDSQGRRKAEYRMSDPGMVLSHFYIYDADEQ